jgi:hypothetical protein
MRYSCVMGAFEAVHSSAGDYFRRMTNIEIIKREVSLIIRGFCPVRLPSEMHEESFMAKNAISILQTWKPSCYLDPVNSLYLRGGREDCDLY